MDSKFDTPASHLTTTVVDLGAGTAETTIWTPATGKRFRLRKLILTTDVAAKLTFKDNTAGTTILVLQTSAGVPIQCDLESGIRSGAVDRVLTVTRGTSSTLAGVLVGTEE